MSIFDEHSEDCVLILTQILTSKIIKYKFKQNQTNQIYKRERERERERDATCNEEIINTTLKRMNPK